jgi:hypothetical protein
MGRFGVDHRAGEGSVGLSDEASLEDLTNDSISDEKDEEHDDEWNFMFSVLPTTIWCSLLRAKAIQELIFTLECHASIKPLFDELCLALFCHVIAVVCQSCNPFFVKNR